MKGRHGGFNFGDGASAASAGISLPACPRAAAAGRRRSPTTGGRSTSARSSTRRTPRKYAKISAVDSLRHICC